MADRQAVAGKSNDTIVAEQSGSSRDASPLSAEAGGGILDLQHAIGNRAVSDRIGTERDALLVDDDSDAAAGQIHKTEFLARLRTEVSASTDGAMSGTGRSSAACPYLEHWIGLAAGRVAAQVERGIRMFAPESARASTVEELISGVKSRVRSGAENEPMNGDAGGLGDALPGVLFKAQEGGAHDPGDPRELQRKLGPGHPVDSQVRSRLEPVLGASLAEARWHTDSNAAALSGQLNARAFTVGDHVAFGAGEYRPGTPAGDALIAHEMAHVVQQSGARETVAPVAELEADADRAAESVVRKNWFGDVARNAMPRVRSGLTLSRCKKEDQHAGTSLPDATRQAALQRELRPASSGGAAAAAPLPWDGLTGAPNFAANRAALKAQLTTDMTTHLTDAMVNINQWSTDPRLPIAQLEGAGRAAKRLVDARYAAVIDTSAMPPGTARHGFQFQATPGGQTLFDAYDPAQRAAAGQAVDAPNLVEWIRQNDGPATTTQSGHHFDPTDPSRGAEEADFWRTEVKAPFVTAHLADLEKYDQFGFGQQSGGSIIVPTSLPTDRSNTPGPNGQPSPAERKFRWDTWELLTHEYIHTLEHPEFSTAVGNGNDIMTEGFCEMFTKEVLVEWIPKAPADSRLRQEVEGGSYPPPPAGTIAPYNPGGYADNLRHAENVRDTVIGAPGGENAVRAAFFQGHVEFLGLTPTGTPAAPVVSGLIPVPGGITTVQALARAANVTPDAILAANAGLTAAGPLPAQVQIPGAREHRVVVAGGTPETITQIADQNGVSESALRRANPGVTWSALTSGQSILIPKHD